MPTTYDDLRIEGNFEISVRVRKCTSAKVEKRAFELNVEDLNGTRFPFIVWEKSKRGRDYNWREGHWYRLSGVTANDWPSGKVMHGATGLEIEHIGDRQFGAHADILFMTDSHLGKRTHSYNGKTWSVSPESGFSSTIAHAIDMDVDGIVHGGDLFHNPGRGISEDDVSLCREKLIELAEAGIPFHFIYGNHERSAGRRVMQRFIDDGLAVHLGPRYQVLGNAIAIYGIDNQSDWIFSALDLETPPDGMPTMLCVHQAVDPFTEKKQPDCTLQKLIGMADIPLNMVVTGDTHTRVEEEVGEVLGLSGGATARVGSSPDDLRPSVEMVSAERGALEIRRHML